MPQRKGGTRALVLLSGGLDSAVALAWAHREGWDVEPLTFDYHARPRREREAAFAVARAVGARPARVVPLPFLREVGDVPVAERLNPALGDAPDGYVPARNLVFYALASHFAEIAGARAIVGGHIGTDAERFGDASGAFFEGLSALNRRGLWTARRAPIDIVLPLKGMAKREVVSLAVELGVPLGDTWSCYVDGASPCASCPSCVERERAFAALGVADPLVATG